MVSSNNEIGLGVYQKGNLVYYTLDMGRRMDFAPISEPVNPPSENTSSNSSSNSEETETQLSLDVNYSLRNSSRYYFYKLYVEANERASIRYVIGDKERRLCSNCMKKSLYVRSRLPLNEIKFYATDKAGNEALKILDIL